MNERIKALVNIALEYADHYDKIGFDDSFQNIFNQKFAELIVRECAKVADKGWAAPGIQIKQYFGVEE